MGFVSRPVIISITSSVSILPRLYYPHHFTLAKKEDSAASRSVCLCPAANNSMTAIVAVAETNLKLEAEYRELKAIYITREGRKVPRAVPLTIGPLPALIKNSCCRYLRRANEHESMFCDAEFTSDGDMLEKM